MIAYLSGKVDSKQENSLILNVNGIGYLVYVTNEILINSKEDLSLSIYTIVREQEISLYGFSNMNERSFFELLISVSGIGPKSALEFFSFSISDVKDAISRGDITFITQVKGVGKKTAERLVVELKNKLGTILIEEGSNSIDKQDAVLALENLGFDTLLINNKLRSAPDNLNTEDLIKWFLSEQ